MESIPPATRSAIVTGGGTGIGYAIAEALARSGFNLSLVGRRGDVLSKSALQLSKVAPGVTIESRTGDLADAAFAESLPDWHCRWAGGLDGLVCAAGIYEQVHALETSAAVWDRVMGANVRGNLLASLAAARQMLARTGGRIVFIGSVLMDQSEPRTLAYAASKAALASIVRSMAVDLADTPVTVNGVAPGWVATAMTLPEQLAPEQMVKVNPQRRACDPAEIAEVVRYLLLGAPRFLSGQMIVVDGGQTVRGATTGNF